MLIVRLREIARAYRAVVVTVEFVQSHPVSPVIRNASPAQSTISRRNICFCKKKLKYFARCLLENNNCTGYSRGRVVGGATAAVAGEAGSSGSGLCPASPDDERCGCCDIRVGFNYKLHVNMHIYIYTHLRNDIS